MPVTGPHAAEAETDSATPGRLRAWWSAATGSVGAVVGLAPHVLHHVGLVAGTALIAGAGGTALFAALGLAATVPLLVRLRRRFASWWAPVMALVVFAVMFSLSAFVIGPAISGGGAPSGDVGPSPSADHTSHHPGNP
jgi:hypothetical protein